MASITYTVLLSTTVLAPILGSGQAIAYCSDASNLSNASFVVNWGKVFSNLYTRNIKYTRVRALLVSKSSGSYTWNANVGTLRCNLPNINTYQSNNGMLILGEINAEDTGLTISTIVHKLKCDSTSTIGASCMLPTGIQTLNVQILDISEALQANVQDYQLVLYFDVYNEPQNGNEYATFQIV